jgi:hypothetical protein
VLPGSERWRIQLTTPTRETPQAPDRAGRTLLVVDQFQEVFTALADAQQDEYLRWLDVAAAQPDIAVVQGVRSDERGLPARFTGFSVAR